MVLKIDPGGLGHRHPLRNMDKRPVGTLDNQECPVGPPVVPAKTYGKTGQGMKTIMNRDFIRGKTGSMGLSRTAGSGTP